MFLPIRSYSELLVRDSKPCAPFSPSSEACCLSFTRSEVKSELQRENPFGPEEKISNHCEQGDSRAETREQLQG